jgi:hypothetical protein
MEEYFCTIHEQWNWLDNECNCCIIADEAYEEESHSVQCKQPAIHKP